MLQCDTVKEMLSNFLDDALEPDLKTQIQSHLDSCTSCNKVFIQVQTITARLQSLTTLKTANNFDQKLRSQIISDKISEKPVVTIRNISYGLSGLAVIAGAYIISTADILQFNGSSDEIQPNQTISNTDPVQNTPMPNQAAGTRDILAADTLKSSPTNLEERDVQLIDNNK